MKPGVLPGRTQPNAKEKKEATIMAEATEYPFVFSVIMAVYNAENYLREAVDSLIVQDIGFEKIQLIMVDDGSTDGSPEICDEYAARYPRNVSVIHKENGGVASARNEGLKCAKGKFLNFMDSDDRMSKDVLRKVHVFFSCHEADTDVITVPIEFSAAVTGKTGNLKRAAGSSIWHRNMKQRTCHALRVFLHRGSEISSVLTAVWQSQRTQKCFSGFWQKK